MRLATVVAVCLSMVGLAVATDTHAAMTKMPTNIPAQGLGPALKTLAKDRGFQVVFRSEVVGSARTQGAVGNLTTPEALTELLKGTDLSYSYLDENTVTIIPLAASQAAAAAGSDQSSQNNTQDKGGNGKNSSQEFRVAQVDQTPVGPQVASGDDQNSKTKKDGDEGLSEIVVTGTHIKGAAPIGSEVITITREDIDRSGYATIGDLIRSLPQNFASISPSVTTYNTNPVAATSPSGASAPDLRGIGASSTLTLVDGRRLASADTFSGSVDISAIPLDAIERVEVVPDGASAVYGSDAVAGVVNIILKKRYDGIQTSLSYGDATDGGGATKRASALLGTNWSNGNIMLAYEHMQQNAVESSQRDFTSTAPVPFDLLPSSSFNSFVMSAHQNITEGSIGFLQGNYIGKQLFSVESLSFAPFTIENQVPSKEYGLTAGLDVDFGSQWTGSLFGSTAKQEYRVYQNVFTTGDFSVPAFVSDPLSYQGTVKSAEWNANGPLYDLGAGQIRSAFGGGYRHETLATTSTHYPGRNVGYAFTEFSIPLIEPSERPGRRRLELSVSGRYEHYSDFGGKAVPKLGLLYSPLQGFNFRTSWGESYRAPTLLELYDSISLDLITLSNPLAPSTSSTVAKLSGANPSLGPESARSWTVGFDFEPPAIERLKVTATYFDINYSNRISQIGDVPNALINPLDAPFVQFNPTAPQVQALVNTYGIESNQTGHPYDPSTVTAIIDARYKNIAQQKISGIDSTVDYKLNTSIGLIDPFVNATYLTYEQQTVPLAPALTVTGLTYYPPRFRGRGGVTWNRGAWSVTTLANYVSDSTDTFYAGNPHVASWTTVDASISYAPTFGHIPKGLRLSASVQNIFDRDPPYAPAGPDSSGLNFDPLNASPLGRFATVGVSLAW